ncbi:E3 ubiquitin protein ligase Topors isoform X1 [Tanacetum coccineum]
MSSSSSYNHQDFIKKHLIPSITKNKTCSICLNNNISNPSLIPSCLHAYCTDCILKWSEFKRECPLCKAKFTSLFVDIDVESVTYRHFIVEMILRADYKCGGAIGISRQELNAVNRRTRPLPRQRSLGETDVLQWRASIYEQNMRAVPCPSRRPVEQDSMGRNCYKERLLQRIEPWIHRELHAVLGDPNPGVLVHLVTSLFFLSLEEGTSRPSGEKINYLERLHPFLSERTITFWHELRCFAESTLNMETYDTINSEAAVNLEDDISDSRMKKGSTS